MQQRALFGGVLLLLLLWGASFSIQKAAYASRGPGAFVFGRSLLMAQRAVALLRRRGRALGPQLARREWGLLLGCTAIGQVAHILLVTCGSHRSTPFSSSLSMACGPVCTLLAAPPMLVLNAQAARVAPYSALSPGIWSTFLWAVLVSAFLGWMLWGWVNAVRGVARTAPLLYDVPPVAGLFAWLTVGEGFGALKIAGAALALGGVARTLLRTEHP